MKKTLLFFLCLLGYPLLAQTRITPDCVIPFTFTAPAATSNLTCGAPNGAPNSNGIASWILVYYSTNFSVVSLVVESAPDNSGAPGSWGTFGGTVLTSLQYPGSSGINPNTSTTSAVTGFAGYFPWMRVRAATLTGSGKLTGFLYGFYNSTLARAGSGGGGGGPTIAGTTNQIAVSGGGCSGGVGTCTISIPNNPVFSGTATAAGFISSESFSGSLLLNGLTSGGVLLGVDDIAGTAIAYILPNVNGSAGQVLQDSGSTTCPTLPAGSPATCHQLIWATVAGGSVTITIANAGSTGTTTSTLTKLIGAPSTAVIAAISDTGHVVGITTAGSGTTGSATIQIAGLVNCVFSNGTTAGDYVQISSVTAGNCADIGSATYPTTGQVIGRVLSTNVGAGTYQIDLFPPEIQGASGGGGGAILHYQYYPAGAGSALWSGTVSFSASNTVTLASGGTSGILGLQQYSSSGAEAVITAQLPPTWDGSALKIIVDGIWQTNNSGNAGFQAYSACVATGGPLYTPPTWTAAGSNVQIASPTTTNALGQWTLTVPVTSCVAGNFVYVEVRRLGTDTYPNSIFVIGFNLGIKY